MSLSVQQVQEGAAGREYDRAQQALIESEQKYRRVVDMATEGMCEIDENGRFGQVSARFAQILGYAPEEMAGRLLVDFLLPEDLEDYNRRDREVRGGLAQRFERCFVAKDGSIRWVSVSTAPVVAADGTFSASLSMMMDITERKNMEKALQLTQLSVDRAVDLVHWLDSEGRVLFVNDATCRRHGFSREEMLGMTVFDLDPLITPEIWADRLQTMRGQDSSAFEVEHVAKSGEVFPLEMVTNHVEYEGKEYVISFGRDISARRQADKVLAETEDRLRQAQKMEAIGQLAGGIAHDFNNLLTAIIGFSELVLAGRDTYPYASEGLFDDVEEIKRAAERAGALTAQILAFSRRQTLRPQVLDMNAIIAETAPLLGRTLGEDVDLVTLAGPDLWPAELDPNQLSHLLVNLAVNARDAMPGGGSLLIETANLLVTEDFAGEYPELAPGPWVMLAVSDTGMGMDKETQARIFEPFFTTKRPGEGTGLGLSTVYGTVTQSGGSVSVHSEPGMGATFKLYFPASDRSRESAEAPTSARAPAGPGSTILVVEDDPAVRGLVDRVLRQDGHAVLTVGDAEEALAVLNDATQRIELLVTDVVLPGGTPGNKLAEAALAFWPGLKILFMSGYTRDGATSAGWFEPDSEFLAKPFRPEVLSAHVRKILTRRPAEVT